MKMGQYFINPKINKAPRKNGAGCRQALFSRRSFSMAGANKLKTGCNHYTSGKPTHSVKHHTVHGFKHKRKSLKPLETK
jgi:hypothetical protein